MSAVAARTVPSASRLRAATLVLFALMLVVTVASAFLRLGEPAGVTGLAADIARGAHRLAASAALVLAIAVAVAGWDRFRPVEASRAVAAALVALGLALAFLGRFTPSTHLFVALANPLGGLAMTGLAWWLYRAAGARVGPAGHALTGAALVAGAFAAVAAMVFWPPGLAAGLAGQVAATVALAFGVTLLHRDAPA